MEELLMQIRKSGRNRGENLIVWTFFFEILERFYCREILCFQMKKIAMFKDRIKRKMDATVTWAYFIDRSKMVDHFYRIEQQEEDLKKKKEVDLILVRLQRVFDAP
ncbi:Uncharacterized protein Fot_14472 [Forsythia ovata]|uniref:Uncharacterized protein n=1 Tax=Forsythia ovata TaxID=205694 RepID=A0ABD1W6F8_9LAMI